MRAVVAAEFGGPEVLRVVELPRPEPGPGEVLVRVAAAGVNPVDLHARSGAVPQWFPPGAHVWGWDVAGVVEGGTGFAPGTRVFGMPRFPAVAGGYAEYLVAPAAELAVLPSAVGFTAGAALPLAGLTAVQTLARCGLRAGQRVLVHGAAGGVGHLAVQVAKAAGATVAGSARASALEFVRGLGADLAVAAGDLPGAGLAAGWGALDLVLDCVGEDRLLALVRPGGVLARVPGAARPGPELDALAARSGVRVVRHVVRPDGPGLAQLCGLRPSVRTFPLAAAARAHRVLAAGGVLGKLVLEVR